MGTLFFYVLCIAAFACFFLCAIDLAFNKDFNMSENLSSAMTLLVSMFVLIMVCTMLSGQNVTIFNGNSSLIDRLNDAVGEAVPFYRYLADAQTGHTLLQFCSQNPLEFAQEFLQTVFMTSVIPLVNHLLPSKIISVGRINKIIMLISVNILTVAITMVLYYFFQKTTVSAILLNFIIALCSATPLVFLVRKFMSKSTGELAVIALSAMFFGKAIITSILYMILINEIAAQKADLLAGFSGFMVILPSIAVCGVMLFGIFMCIRSVFR